MGDGVRINFLCGPLQRRFTGWLMVVPGNGMVFQGGGGSGPPVPPLDPHVIMLSNYILMLTVVYIDHYLLS